MVDLFYLEAMGAWMVGFWALWGSWGPVRAWTSVGPGRAYRGALGGPGVGAVGSLGALWAPLLSPLAPLGGRGGSLWPGVPVGGGAVGPVGWTRGCAARASWGVMGGGDERGDLLWDWEGAEGVVRGVIA